MPSPASTIPLSLVLVGWWLPVLGLLLAGLGVALVAIAVEDLVAPVRSPRSIAGALVSAEPISGRAVLTAPVGRGTGTGAEEIVQLAPGRRARPATCLGADLATGRRAESAHLATVPLQRPADCGDLRDVVVGLAVLPHTGRAVGGDPGAGAEAVPPEAGELDRTAAALYGPPDRQPQATLEALLEAGVPDSGRGRARGYLEETAVSRLLAP
jgi:hypothetical protein